MCDILEDISSQKENVLNERRYDICLDKGTYDAVSLDPSDAKTKREMYRRNVKYLLRPGGLFILTSCNWTEKELKEFFCEGLLVLICHVTDIIVRYKIALY